MRVLAVLLTVLTYSSMSAQEADAPLPYHTIPEAPENYTAGTMVSRMIDGLGFRYYWATEGLTPDNLTYTPSEKARSLSETMDHLYGLSQAILYSAKKKVDDRSLQAKETLSFEEKRKRTLHNFLEASTIYKATTDIASHKITFRSKNGDREFSFWNNINGFIEDAVWHSGQVVVLRRSAGNPINPKVNVFLGKLND